ncbi:hypothetical protein [Paracoccus tegillarcae]|uniref:Uncharacterized protein n=1 Tax=Paracoccus tegillarcae TaxID=1529068 RepID=A0A2K9EPK8_9RHOB|nr:hypothetical protein [Paracoccus tegillarcae]AUH33585.1 hypothetical protein CUV01_09465 [Paracoccus tegillarcae]
MTHKAHWLSIYDEAVDAALAAREAEWRAKQSADLDRCKRECRRAIGEFDTFWRHFADESDLRSIRDKVLNDLPKVTLENGTECREETLRPPGSKDPDAPAFQEKWEDADEFRQYLATTLPEIECRVDGDPPEASVDWAETDRQVRVLLEPLTDASEVTTGTASMSRRSYAAEALRLLAEVRNLSQMMATAPAEDATSEEEQRWLLECFAEIAARAFNAGVLGRAAAGKAIEKDAKRGAATLRASNMGGDMTRGTTTPETDAKLEFMYEKLSQRLNPSAAARSAFKAGFGTSFEANRRLLYRHHRK